VGDDRDVTNMFHYLPAQGLRRRANIPPARFSQALISRGI
jgi:hypothetical protein